MAVASALTLAGPGAHAAPKPNHGNGNGNSSHGGGGSGGGNSGNGGGGGSGGGNGGPGGGNSSHAVVPGNNGTVKIANLGDIDHIPNNSPHQTCSFLVQWYGFDAGADVISHVTFSPQAPTGGVHITVSGPSTVNVGEDAASGAGTATSLDAAVAYTLSFSGGPPAHQGYHVKLTVATPHSKGNDTKTKVFWVGPCAASPPPAVQSTPPPTGSGTHSGNGTAPLSAGNQQHSAPGVVKLPQSKPSHVSAPATVPTVIEAGKVAPVAATPWGPLGLTALGGLVIAGAALSRRRRGA